MPHYTVNEPHPTVQQNGWTHSGRGGSGNYFRAPQTTPASGIATSPQTSKSSSGRFYSGRGGAGNAHAAAVRPVMSFDEEFNRQSHQESKVRGHVGRGGAGNAFDSTPAHHKTRQGSDASSSSSSSVRRSGFFKRLSSVASREN